VTKLLGGKPATEVLGARVRLTNPMSPTLVALGTTSHARVGKYLDRSARGASKLTPICADLRPFEGEDPVPPSQSSCIYENA
jgi:hypothetical protein